jgi:hypothetical protein
MKNLIIALCLLVALPAFAQKKDQKHAFDTEKIDAERMAYLKEKVTLTPQQASAFWPLYEQYRVETNALRKGSHHRKVDFNEMTAEEMENHIQEGFRIREQKVALQKKYHQQFTRILPVEKVVEVYMAEKHFWRDHMKKNSKKKQ